MADLNQVTGTALIHRDTELFKHALIEAERHKWIESEKAGRDLGEEALRDWSRRYWWKWCRDRWIEHLSGERYWGELDREDFELLKRNFHANTRLISVIVELIKHGGENLDIIQWTLDRGESLNDALEILTLLDINSRRFNFWP
ncbi:MAG: hypothetical protein M5U26_29495 [Planctomycetota bacterium]|nr:hypothetical protein [Planctomycetota bacterium]